MGGGTPADEVGALTRVMVRICAAALVATGVLLLGDDIAESAASPSASLAVRTSITPTVQFGDPLTAHVVVLMDRAAVDVHRLRVTSAVAPLTQLTPTHVSRFSRGPLDVAAFDLTAACLDQRCVTPGGTRVLRLPPVTVEVATRGGSPVSVTQPWPELTVRGRVIGADLERSRLPFRTDLDPPRVSYRMAPSKLAVLLAIGAVALALTAIALAGLQAIRIVRRRHVVETTELERALALARSAETRSPEDRRRALGLLARLLRSREERLARATSALAWSAPEPTPDSVSSLVEHVGHEVEAR